MFSWIHFYFKVLNRINVYMHFFHLGATKQKNADINTDKCDCQYVFRSVITILLKSILIYFVKADY